MKAIVQIALALVLGSSFAVASSAHASTVDIAAGQKTIDTFLSQHEVAKTYFFCRTDIATPECRTLMIYRDKTTKTLVNSFQMAFSAPFRQAGGTEFFLEAKAGLFDRWTDFIIDGKVQIDGGSAQDVHKSGGTIVIKNLKLGASIGSLTFGTDEAVFLGTKPSAANPAVSERVELIYPAFTAVN